MLQLKNICKYYKSGDGVVRALDDVSITFRDTEFVSILGPSGSGKTTMLNVIGGLDGYTRGSLVINGKSTEQFKAADWDAYRNNEVGFVFQNYNLIMHQTILQNVELALTLSGVGHKERRERSVAALTQVGLADHINKYPNQLSGGQMQRVSIARALVNNPSIIFADEPTGALDSETSVQIMDILKDISKTKLVVMVTHNPELAEIYSTRIVNVKDGRLVADSNPCEDGAAAAKIELDKPKKQKTSMSFLTAMRLSFANLKGKKGRTFMTAFAGSIGIIGIAIIMAISTGVNGYVKEMETEGNSSLTISKTKQESAFSSYSTDDSAEKKDASELEQSQSFSINNKVGANLKFSGTNDLESFINYVEQNPDEFMENLQSYQAEYNSKPIIYLDDVQNPKQIFPNSFLKSVTETDDITNDEKAQKIINLTNYSGSNVTFLPKSEDVYKDSGTVVAGSWPKDESECVLVLKSDGTLDDSLVYALGLRDSNEYITAINNFKNDMATGYPEKFDPMAFSNVLGKTFRVLNSAEMYQKQADGT